MIYPLYDFAGLVIVNNKEYKLNDLLLKAKTRTIRNEEGFTFKIKVENIRISPRSNWRKHFYCQMFNDYEATCFLCGKATLWNDKCNCPKSFSVDEYINNIPIVRRNIVKWHLLRLNNVTELNNVDSWSDQEINNYLFEDKPNERVIKINI